MSIASPGCRGFDYSTQFLSPRWDQAEEISYFVLEAAEDLDMHEAQSENNPWPGEADDVDLSYADWGANRWGWKQEHILKLKEPHCKNGS